MRLSFPRPMLVAAAIAAAVAITGVARAQQDILFDPIDPSQPANWNDANNWNPPFVPDATLDLNAVISSNRSAFVIDTPPATGGIAINAGTLDVRAGGNLSAVAGSAVQGNIVVGSGTGVGNLTVHRGGALHGQNLTTGGGTASQITVGEITGSGTATFTVNGGTINRTTRIVGPNVSFSSSGNLAFQSPSVLNPVITGSTHSTIQVTGTASLGGTVRPEFQYTPATGASWTLLSATALQGSFTLDGSQLPPVPRGTGFQLRQTTASSILELTNKLILTVGRSTGLTRIENAIGAPIEIEGYTITSPGAHLGGVWNSLQEQHISAWDEADNTSSSRLTEFNPTGTSNITAGNFLQLGNPYVPTTPTAFGQVVGEDLSFQYAAPGLGTVQGIVEYTGPHNNLVLTIDPTTGGAAIQNESPFFNVALEGYTIRSTSGRLQTGDADWNSLDDQNVSNWDQADNSDNFRLTEFNPMGTTSLSGGGTVLNLGTPIDNAGSPLNVNDFSFELALAGGQIMQGVVVIGTLPTAVGLPGDYNQNNVVDAADYVIWRKKLGSGTSLPNDTTPGVGADDYTRWRANFGAIAGAGSSLSQSTVPEPTTSVLSIAFVVAALAARVRRVERAGSVNRR